MNNDTALIPAQPSTWIPSVFDTADAFADAQRMANLLSSSEMVPVAYRGKLPNCVIALELSRRLKLPVLSVMQSLDIIHGRPSWRSTFLIGSLNSSGRFSPIRFEMTSEEQEEEIPYSFTVYEGQNKNRKEGKVRIRNRECTAWAMDRAGEKLVGPPVSLRMAVQEGWYTKDGSKWKTMPDLMLRYRAAAFFSRLYAPEITLGFPTAEEAGDIIDITDSSVSITHTNNPLMPAGEPETPAAQPAEPPKPRTRKPRQPVVETAPQPQEPAATPEVTTGEEEFAPSPQPPAEPPSPVATPKVTPQVEVCRMADQVMEETTCTEGDVIEYVQAVAAASAPGVTVTDLTTIPNALANNLIRMGARRMASFCSTNVAQRAAADNAAK